MRILAENKKALFKYSILEKYKAGIVLKGQEVKSIKLGRINISGSYIILKAQAPFLIGSNVPPYQPKNLREDYNPERSRKLLLRGSEIKELIGKTHQKGLTLVPLKVYTDQSKIKIEFGLCRGKKTRDKREQIKQREQKKEIERTLKIRG